ncbi:MAG: hypothetical protein P4L57_13085 [Rhizomicrobium sp.]|nr:hypothetical protein [Rhizomicrobium sp.]
MPMGKRSTLAAAADRLDRLVQDIKRQQYEATGLRQAPLPQRSGLDPEADWGRRFSVWSLKPTRVAGKGAPFGSFALPRAGQPKKPVFADKGAALDDRTLPPENLARGGHIGAVLNKPGPRRGLFNRLFRRDN